MEGEQPLQAMGSPAMIPFSPTWCYYCLNPRVTFVTVVQSLGVQLFPNPCTAACQASLSFAASQNLLKLMSIDLVMPQPPHPLSSPSPPAFNLSQNQGLNRIKLGSLLSWLGLMTSVLSTGHAYPLRQCLWLEHLFHALCCAGAPGKPCRMHCQGHALRSVCLFRAPHLSCSATQ